MGFSKRLEDESLAEGALPLPPAGRAVVLTSEYLAVHGRAPRGPGNWWWAFGAPEAKPMLSPGIRMRYAEAVKWARLFAREVRVGRVWLLP
jgi:hypothetical protein